METRRSYSFLPDIEQTEWLSYALIRGFQSVLNHSLFSTLFLRLSADSRGYVVSAFQDTSLMTKVL